MTENFLVKLFERNNWANLQIIQACSALSNEQRDAEPQSATKGSIRLTLSPRGFAAGLPENLDSAT